MWQPTTAHSGIPAPQIPSAAPMLPGQARPFRPLPSNWAARRRLRCRTRCKPCAGRRTARARHPASGRQRAPRHGGRASSSPRGDYICCSASDRRPTSVIRIRVRCTGRSAASGRSGVIVTDPACSKSTIAAREKPRASKSACLRRSGYRQATPPAGVRRQSWSAGCRGDERPPASFREPYYLDWRAGSMQALGPRRREPGLHHVEDGCT